MDLDERIERRRGRADAPRLVRDYRSLSPVAHVDEPSDRGPVFERLLDHLDPVFDGEVPPDAYLSGPAGSGKSAVVTALFARLDRLSTGTRSVVHTSTREASRSTPRFVYADLRGTSSEFAFYRDVLDGLVDESVPEHGVSTAELRERLHDRLGGSRPGAVIAVDHVGEPGGLPPDDLLDLLAGLPGTASWLAVGRSDPGETALADHAATSVRVEPYGRQVLVDVLTTRASGGLARGALDHDLARRIAEWADGDAHDALAALFVAADLADRADRTRLAESDVTAAIEGVPDSPVSLGRVLALPANRQAVLRELVDLDGSDRESVTATAEAVGSSPAIDLSPGTVERFLYEMAEVGVVERVRVRSRGHRGKGRPPSRIEPRFPPAAFRRLYDLRRRDGD